MSPSAPTAAAPTAAPAPAVPAAPNFQALEDAVTLAAQVAAAVIAAPKPLTAASLANLFPLLGSFEKVAGEVSQLAPDVKALDLAESERLLGLLASNLGTEAGKAEAIVAAGLQVVQSVTALIAAVKS